MIRLGFLGVDYATIFVRNLQNSIGHFFWPLYSVMCTVHLSRKLYRRVQQAARHNCCRDCDTAGLPQHRPSEDPRTLFRNMGSRTTVDDIKLNPALP